MSVISFFFLKMFLRFAASSSILKDAGIVDPCFYSGSVNLPMLLMIDNFSFEDKFVEKLFSI
jgi:hypothetical protein